MVYRGCAIPVAWNIVAAEEKGSWRPYWIGLLTHLRDSVPPQWTVIVMSDRGLYAPWLYQHIMRVGWHPFMRMNKQDGVVGSGTRPRWWIPNVRNGRG